MAITLDPTIPADSESPRQGAARIRNLTLNLLSLLSQGGGSAVTFTAAPFSVDTSGNVTVPTTIVVPTPTGSTQAATKGYVDNLTVSAPSVTTTLVNSSITAGSNAKIFTINSTPPGTTQLYRAFVTGTVYFQAVSTGSGTAYESVAIVISSSPALFNQNASAQGYMAANVVQPNLGLSCSGLSTTTHSGSGGAVTFNLTGYVDSGSTFDVNVKTASTTAAALTSYLLVAWIPAQ